jgi:transcriptional regulator with XRE-family HTH domain
MSPAHPAHAERRHAFGAQLRQARRTAGLTQKQLAAAAAVDRVFLSKVERGESAPGLDWIGDVAAALGVSIADLVAGLT